MSKFPLWQYLFFYWYPTFHSLTAFYFIILLQSTGLYLRSVRILRYSGRVSSLYSLFKPCRTPFWCLTCILILVPLASPALSIVPDSGVAESGVAAFWKVHSCRSWSVSIYPRAVPLPSMDIDLPMSPIRSFIMHTHTPFYSTCTHFPFPERTGLLL